MKKFNVIAVFTFVFVLSFLLVQNASAAVSMKKAVGTYKARYVAKMTLIGDDSATISGRATLVVKKNKKWAFTVNGNTIKGMAKKKGNKLIFKKTRSLKKAVGKSIKSFINYWGRKDGYDLSNIKVKISKLTIPALKINKNGTSGKVVFNVNGTVSGKANGQNFSYRFKFQSVGSNFQRIN